MASYTTDSFIEKAKEVHGNRYDYSKVSYIDAKEKVTIICSDHGEFTKSPANHLKGQGCQWCVGKGKLSKEDFITQAKEVHGNKYDYSKVDYQTKTKKVIIICSEHGEFHQSPKNHLKGQKCPGCSGKLKLSQEDFIAKCKEVHGNKYNYDKVVYESLSKKVEIICDEHGSFFQKASSHIKGANCPTCAKSKNGLGNSKGQEAYIKACSELHNYKYDYSKTIYVNAKTPVIITCPGHGDFEQSSDSHSRGIGCPKCSSSILSSKAELELKDYIETTLGLNIETNIRGIIGRKELDIYIPSLKIGIEYHGLYWHSSQFVSNDYHLEKLKAASDKGIRLIQIFEDEWRDKENLIKDRLAFLCGYRSKRIFARKTTVRKSTNAETKALYDKHHIQGHITYGQKVYVLEYDNEVVAAMSFKQLDDSTWDLSRFASSCSVVGGFSKLLKAFLKDTKEAKCITSFADLRWSVGDVYTKNGFYEVYRTKPNYTYNETGVRVRKEHYRHKYLKDKLKIYDPSKSELENTLANGIYRIYDCGLIKFQYDVDF